MRPLLDSDVMIPTQPSVTTGFNLMSAVIASAANHPYVRACLDYYSELKYDPQNYRNVVINPIMSLILHRGWGYEYADKTQDLKDGIRILDRTYFGSDFDIKDSEKGDLYGIHFCNQSWVPSNRGLFYRFCKSNDLMSLYRLITSIIQK